MKQITTIKVHSETSQELKDLKKEYRVKSKEKVIQILIKNNNLRKVFERTLIPTHGKKTYRRILLWYDVNKGIPIIEDLKELLEKGGLKAERIEWG